MFSCWPLGQVDGRGDEIPREYKLQTPGDDDAATMHRSMVFWRDQGLFLGQLTLVECFSNCCCQEKRLN